MRLTLALVVVFALTSVGAALAAGGDPQKRIVPADQARAKTMLVRKTDLSPAFTARPSTRGSDFYCSALDESDLTLTGDAVSPSFTATAEFVTSTADVYVSRADASASWRRGTSAAGQKCLRIGLRAELQGANVRLLSFKRLPFPKRGQRSIAFRAVASEQGIRVYVDLVAMQYARAEAAVVYISGLAPPPRAEMIRLSALVAKRMEAAMRRA